MYSNDTCEVTPGWERQRVSETNIPPDRKSNHDVRTVCPESQPLDHYHYKKQIIVLVNGGFI